MNHVPFSLQDSLIAYGDGKHAARVPFPLTQMDDVAADWLIGVMEFTDDASVHANDWECHPDGDEILCVLEGRLLAFLDHEGMFETEVTLAEGQALIVPQGVWHRLQVVEPGRLAFFTPIAGTALRPYGAAVGMHRENDPSTGSRLSPKP